MTFYYHVTFRRSTIICNKISNITAKHTSLGEAIFQALQLYSWGFALIKFFRYVTGDVSNIAYERQQAMTKSGIRSWRPLSTDFINSMANHQKQSFQDAVNPRAYCLPVFGPANLPVYLLAMMRERHTAQCLSWNDDE